jgi:hypothetical protein
MTMHALVRLRATFLGTIFLALAALGGCETAGQGAVTGGAVGALSGLAIGSMTGSAGKGAAIGAVTGVVGGAIIGDQNRRKHQQAMAKSPAPTPPPPPVPAAAAVPYDAVAALERFVGRWKVDGWAQPPGRERTRLSGEATGIADKNFFVRVEIQLADPGGGESIEGTCILSQNGGRKVTMVNSFSTSPDTMRFEGELDPSGSIFTLNQVSPKTDRRIVLRQSGTASWVAEAWESAPGGDVRTESLTFTAG